jgi:hypothetical protein
MPKFITVGSCLILFLCAGSAEAEVGMRAPTFEYDGHYPLLGGVGENQTAEVYICEPGQRVSGSPSYIPLTVGVINPSDPACTQTFDVTSESPSRLHVFNIRKGFGFITVGDDDLDLTDSCWKDPAQQRAILSVRYRVPPDTAARIAEDPDLAKELIPHLMGVAIVEDGKTIDKSGIDKADQWRCNAFRVD